MRTQQVFKVVVERSDKKLKSSFIINDYCIEYKLNTIIKPNIGKIFCFKQPEYAEQYIKYTFSLPFEDRLFSEKVLLLMGEGTDISIPKYICGWVVTENINKYWSCKKNHKKYNEGSIIPFGGTVLVSSFTPTQIVFDSSKDNFKQFTKIVQQNIKKGYQKNE